MTREYLFTRKAPGKNPGPCNYAYNPDGDWTSCHQMTLNVKRDGFTREVLVTVGREMSIKKSAEIIDEVVEAVPRGPRLIDEQCSIVVE